MGIAHYEPFYWLPIDMTIIIGFRIGPAPIEEQRDILWDTGNMLEKSISEISFSQQHSQASFSPYSADTRQSDTQPREL